MVGLHRVFARLRAHEAECRSLPDPAEVEAVRIPTGTDRGIVRMVLFGVPGAGIEKAVEGLVIKIKEGAAEFEGVYRPAFPVVGVGPLVDPAGIVKLGEEPHHEGIASRTFRKPEPVALNPPPVGGAVDGIAPEDDGAGDSAGEFGEIALAVRGRGSVGIGGGRGRPNDSE